MGEVYLAEDTRLHRKVAIKFLFTGDESKNLLIREARATAALDHPNICAIFEVGEEQNRGFIVMQYVEGETLASRLAATCLEPAFALDIGIQVAGALAEAHAAGIVHRDIKPQNIMITGRGQTKVLDFGLAKLPKTTDSFASVGETESLPGIVMGTAPYMSPEQVRGESLDPRSDVFSFGIVLYEILTGQRPFLAKSTAELFSAILTHEPMKLTQCSPDLPPELERIVSRCLNKDRVGRYPSARQLLEDLQSVSRALSGPNVALKPSPSIAVLAFVNMSADAENEYFCDGLAEELINALTKIEHLNVAARTSAFSFKGKEMDVREIGRKLNVGAVLVGSVRKAGRKLRITAQLVNVADGYHQWSDRYDRELEDIFDIQDEISLAIVDALKVKLLGAEKAAVLKRYTENAEAHELYLKGRYFWLKFNPEGWKKSRECFEQALQKDPNFALAYAGLADALVVSGIFTSPKELASKARDLVLRAIELDPSMTEAWTSSAAIKFFHEWDWAGAESDCRQAIALNPRYVLAHDLYCLILLTQGKFQEATREAGKACELEPLSAYFNASLGLAFYFSQRYDEATKQLLKALELDKDNMRAHLWLVDVYEQKGVFVEALHHRQRLLTLAGNHELAVEMGDEFQRSGYQAVLLKWLKGLHQQSQHRYVSPLDFAATFVQLGEQDKALDWLEKAFEERSLFLVFLNVRPAWDSLRSNGRYSDLLRRMGLPVSH